MSPHSEDFFQADKMHKHTFSLQFTDGFTFSDISRFHEENDIWKMTFGLKSSKCFCVILIKGVDYKLIIK